MKRIGRDQSKLESLNLFSLLQSSDGSTIYDPANRQSFLSQVDSGLSRALQSEATLHGIRVQSMFEGMAASLGSVQLLKAEDVGNCYHQGEDIRIPDFRVLTTKAESMLIETKNHYSNDPMRPFRIRSSDLRALARYTAMLGARLRLAIYWARWNHWTLNDPGRFNQNGTYAELNVMQAMKQSEMATLGDFSIGTRYPLAARFLAATDRPRSVSAAGIASFRLRGAEIRCA